MRVPEDRLLVETDAPYLTPQAVRKERNRPANVTLTAEVVAEERGVAVRAARGAGRAQRRRAVRLVRPGSRRPTPQPPEPTQPSLRRLRAFGVRPKRDLGQNFLIDSNILDVIARAAEVGPEDVVLEIGGGLGVLSEHLAARAAHVHVVEVDRSLEPALRDALDPFGASASLHLADAMTLDLGALAPAPTKVVANLPYGIAAGAILRTIEQLPGATRWVAMVQKEVGERFAAGPGTAAYGVPSVIAQLACDVRVLRPISRRVFLPVPNVDSVLVGLERRGAGAARRRCGRSCRARSRTAARRSRGRSSLAGVGGARRGARRAGGARRAARRARRAARAGAAARAVGGGRRGPGRSGDVGASGAHDADALAPGKTNLCLFLGGTRADGLHELVSVIEPLSLADELTLEPLPGGADVATAVGAGDMGCAAGEDEVVCAGVEGPNLAGEALAAYRAASGWDGPPLRLTIVKRVPVAAGMGGGSGDAAAALRLAAHAAGRPDDPLLAQLAPRLGADVPSQLAPGPVLVGGAGEEVRPLPPLPPHGVLVLPSPHALADARRVPRGRPARAGAQRPRSWPSGARRWRRRSRATASCRRAARQRPRSGGALAVPVDRRRARGGACGGRRPGARVGLRARRSWGSSGGADGAAAAEARGGGAARPLSRRDRRPPGRRRVRGDPRRVEP